MKFEVSLVPKWSARKAQAELTSVDYTPASSVHGWDMQTPYLKVWLESTCISDVTVIPVEKKLYRPEVDRASGDAVKADAVRLAASF